MKRLTTTETPASHPHLFDQIPASQAQAGDIYQGSKNRRKWYENERGQTTVDSWRTYFRRKGSASSATAAQPPVTAAASGGATQASPSGGATGATVNSIEVADVEQQDDGSVKVGVDIVISKTAFAEFVADFIADTQKAS